MSKCPNVVDPSHFDNHEGQTPLKDTPQKANVNFYNNTYRTLCCVYDEEQGKGGSNSLVKTRNKRRSV